MNTKPRRTKIIATLGPATDSQDVMLKLIDAGINIVRINLSHGKMEDQARRIELARQCAQMRNVILGVLLDLQGPKIRISKFKDPQGVLLHEGSPFVLDAELDPLQGDTYSVGLDYKALPDEVAAHDQLLLDDGRIILTVKAVQGRKIECVVKVGGRLYSNKGLNRKGGGLSAKSLTEKDLKDIAFIATQQVDYVALSFPKGAADIVEARKLLKEAGSSARIVAKIERAEAVENVYEIIESADAVMVARGDLGVEVGYAELPGIQKNIISLARQLDKAVITATQMMESMINNPIPTRAEVSDVANAILDGTDAVMLSAETATGSYPVQVVQILDEICLAAERQRCTKNALTEDSEFEQLDKAIAKAAMYIANHVPIKAIVTLTESGTTPLCMSRVRSGIPIYALSRHAKTCGRVTLFRGVYPVQFDVTQYKIWEISRFALETLVNQGILEPGDKVLLTKGDILGVGGHTNGLKILTA